MLDDPTFTEININSIFMALQCFFLLLKSCPLFQQARTINGHYSNFLNQ